MQVLDVTGLQLCLLVFNSIQKGFFNSDVEWRNFLGMHLFFRMEKVRVVQSQLSDKSCCKEGYKHKVLASSSAQKPQQALPRSLP